MANPLSSAEVISRLLVTISLPVLSLALAPSSGFAGSATWKAAPPTGLWNSSANWDPETVPNDPTATATFQHTSKSSISLSAPVTIGAAIFNLGSSTYTITVGPALSLIFAGAGLTNPSGTAQSFIATTDAAGEFGVIGFSGRAAGGPVCTFTTEPGIFDGASGSLVQFTNTANAGESSLINNGATISGGRGGETDFFDDTSAGNASCFANAGTAFSTAGGTIAFFGASTAGTADLTARGGALQGAFGGAIYFREDSSASGGSITIEGGAADFSTGGNLYFEETASGGTAFVTVRGGQASGTSNGATANFLGSSTAGSATIFVRNDSAEGAQPGRVFFYEDSSGGTARIEGFGGEVDFSDHNPGTVTVGSIEFECTVYLGSITLEIGGNGFADLLEGSISDGGANGGSGASLTKVGHNSLTLLMPNHYTGGTTINDGAIIVESRKGSATGSGPVQVNAGGTLGGFGRVAGTITIASGGSIAPGNFGTARLTTKRALIFESDARYDWEFNTINTTVDVVGAMEVTISSGARFNPSRLGDGALQIGRFFVILENGGADPIGGTFANLSDGSVIRVGSNKFEADYEGGDGNDLTLTVVP